MPRESLKSFCNSNMFNQFILFLILINTFIISLMTYDFPTSTLNQFDFVDRDYAYIIESGRVEVSKQINGERQSIGVLKEGDIFGEMGLIDGLPRSASVVSLEDSSISIITQETFNSLAQHNAQALMPILKVLAKRLRATLKLVEDLQDGKKASSSTSNESL